VLSWRVLIFSPRCGGQYALTAVSGFPVWRALRLEGERQERKLQEEKAKGGHAH